MKALVDDTMITIFKFVNRPLSLILSSRNWLRISKNPHARSEWLITKYGRSNALYNAAMLGPSFIDIRLYRILTAGNVKPSPYFFQRLLMHLEKYDQKLIQLKTINYNGQLDVGYYGYTINESKSNDTKLFHFLACGTHMINCDPKISLKDIEVLLPQSTNTSGYSSKVDYENGKIDFFNFLKLINILAQESTAKTKENLDVKHEKHNKLNGRYVRQNKLNGNHGRYRRRNKPGVRHGRQNKLEGRHGRKNKLSGRRYSFGKRYSKQGVNANRHPIVPRNIIVNFIQQPQQPQQQIVDPIIDPIDQLADQLINGSPFA
ncbi:hypothetical protein RclHR1_00110017 [Rhizophagus clarus]|uniref:Uncharacterized protein n=1 Tax=Rhizophagus clarus TaxID=94130 RepID=A0A2Z6QHV1_9GLOM|nr:hypothetical protein RclHR1_00110017 [Rhizophagus clarus]GES98004.1 hypothetical protein GLOIN_2v1471977 [Rhizophagus clarus]